MHRTELFHAAAPNFIPGCRRPTQLKEEIAKQADELLKKGKVQESTSAFGLNPVQARKGEEDGECVSTSSL